MEVLSNSKENNNRGITPSYQNLSAVEKRIEVIEYYLTFFPDNRIGDIKNLIIDEGLQKSILEKRCDYILTQINQSSKANNYENTK